MSDPNLYQRLQAEAMMRRQEEERHRQEDERRRQEEAQRQAEEQRRQEEERRRYEEAQKQAEEKRRQEEARHQAEEARQAEARRQMDLAQREVELRKQAETAAQMAKGQADAKTQQSLATLAQVNPQEYAKLRTGLTEEAQKAGATADIVKQQHEYERKTQQQIDAVEKTVKAASERSDLYKKEDIEKAKTDLKEFKDKYEKQKGEFREFVSPELAPFVIFKTEQKRRWVGPNAYYEDEIPELSIDVEGAIKAGVPKLQLKKAGVTEERIIKAEVNIKRGIRPLTPAEAALQDRLQIAVSTLEGNRSKRIEKKLAPYITATGGIDYYTALKDGVKPETLRQYGLPKERVDFAIRSIKLQDDALSELIDYKGEDGYYLASYIKDKHDAAPGSKRDVAVRLAERTLLNAGYSKDEIARARVDALSSPSVSMTSAYPDKKGEARLLSESNDNIQQFLGGSGVKPWTYAALLGQGKLDAKEIYNKLDIHAKRQVIDYYVSRDGQVPSFAEQIAASPIPQIEGMIFQPLGKIIAGQKVEALDVGIGIAQLALWAAPVVNTGVSKLVSGALPKLGVNAITSNVAAVVAGKAVQAAIPAGTGTFFLTEHATKLLPDKNVPLYQKVLAISFDTLLITTGLFGMAGAVKYTRGAKINSMPEMAIKDTMNIVRKATPLTSAEAKAIEKALRRIQQAIINNNKTELVSAARELELAQKGRVLFSEASSIRLNPEQYLKMTRDVALKMKPEHINVNTRFIRTVADDAVSANRINQLVEQINRETGAAYTPRRVIEARQILSKAGQDLGKIDKGTSSKYTVLKKTKMVPKYDVPTTKAPTYKSTETLTPLEYQVYRTIKNVPAEYGSKAEFAAYLAKKIPERVRMEGFTGAAERYGMATVKAVYPKLTKAALDAEKYLYKLEEPAYLAMKNRAANNLSRYIHNTLMESPVPGGEQGLPSYERLISEELVGYRRNVLSPAELAKKFPGYYKGLNLKNINGVVPAEVVSDIVSSRPNIFVTKGGSWKLVPTEDYKSQYGLKYPLYVDDPYLKSEILRTLSGKYTVYGEGGAVEIGAKGQKGIDVTVPEGKINQLVTYTVKPTKTKSKDLQLTRAVDIPLIRHDEPTDEMAAVIKGRQKYIDNQPVYKAQITPISGKNKGKLMEVVIPLDGNTVQEQAENMVGAITDYVEEFGMEKALNTFGRNAVTAVYPYAIEYALTEMEDYTPPSFTARSIIPTKPLIDEPTEISSGLATALKVAGRAAPQKTKGSGGGSRGLTPDQELARMTGAQLDKEGGQSAGVSVRSKPSGGSATSVMTGPGGTSSAKSAVSADTSPQTDLKPTMKPIPVIKAETQTEVKPSVKPRVKAETLTGINIDITAPVVKEQTVKQKLTDIDKPLPQPSLPVPGKGKKGKDAWTAEEIDSAIAWKQGTVVHALKSPYRRGIDERTFHISKIPKDLVYLDEAGKGSPQKSLKVTGAMPAQKTVDVGNQDVIITRTQPGRAKIVFRHDTRGTRSDLTVKRNSQVGQRLAFRGTHNLSKKKGKLHYTNIGGSQVVSRRPIRGY